MANVYMHGVMHNNIQLTWLTTNIACITGINLVYNTETLLKIIFEIKQQLQKHNIEQYNDHL